ncbi:MAG: hypothetical protein ABI597_03135 [Gammaproteobacteria bacterium]
MKFLSLPILATIMTITNSYAQSNTTCIMPTQTIPFQIAISSNCVVPVSYSFGTHFNIFCYTESLATTGSITWTYQGQLQQSTLPIELTISADYAGSFADSRGAMSIINTEKNSVVLNCDFAF